MIQVTYGIGHKDVLSGWQSGPAASSGGASIRYRLKNCGGKTIRCYVLYFIPYNASDEEVGCTITGKTEKGMKGMGPIGHGQVTSDCIFENVWFNPAIARAVISRVEIQYDDDSEETISGGCVSSIREPRKKKGCYVATAVYGSYDCPQVWTLRRYRDETLVRTWYGRAFVKLYYALSPTLVRWFGQSDRFRRMWRGRLDRFVEKLHAEGVSDAPYTDSVR